uniref:Uncharacterized protein n=1 Tax=Leptobrachium leishanense TaxID=445787 RepID=A0A8C5QBU1_9ANUR
MGKPRRPPTTPGPARDPPTSSIRQFLTPIPDTVQAPMRDKMAATPASSAPSSPTRSTGPWDFPPELHHLLSSLPTKADLAASTSGLQDSLLTEIRGLCKELGSLQHRVQHVETTQARQSETLTTHTTSLQSQHQILQTMARHLEDLENRGRQNNIRVRGLPELEQSPSDLKRTLLRLFNGLIQRSPDTEIEFERLHRALRPKGPPDAPPRDVVCCLRHTVKEEIMEAARQSRTVIFEDASITLFQDRSPATLQSRRLLCPLMAALQERRIAYKWLFPFGIQVRTDAGPATLRSELDLPGFLEALALPKDIISAWLYLTHMYAPSFGAPSRPQRPRRRRYSTRTLAPSESQDG